VFVKVEEVVLRKLAGRDPVDDRDDVEAFWLGGTAEVKGILGAEAAKVLPRD
jgi:hypothetical protein